MNLGALKKGPIDQYLNDARGNSHKKALLCAAYASTRQDENAAAEYMQVNAKIMIYDRYFKIRNFLESL
jgi:hypothetical protein